MTLVAGVDSSTQSCKVVVADLDTGTVLRSGRAEHPAGTEADPGRWEHALSQACAAVGGIEDVAALAVAGQQHGCVCLDEQGRTVRPAELWNDTRSAPDARDLIAERGAHAWARDVGSVPVASFTVTKLRRLAREEPASAHRTAAVCLPHDWLTWRLAGRTDVTALTTDRGDASGTGYWSPADAEYRPDLLRLALGHDALVPAVLPPSQPAGRTPSGAVLGPGTGDNAAAALALDLRPGDVVLSIGTSGTLFASHRRPTADASGAVAGFADATGAFLPLVCTMNAAQVLDATARLLGIGVAGLSDLALSAPAGADGLVLVPYLAGERTPDLPLATGSLLGLTHRNLTPACLARAAYEGVLCGLADALDRLTEQGVEATRVLLIGGAAVSPAVQTLAPAVLGRPVQVVRTAEHVAAGAARQAAWALRGGASPPPWPRPPTIPREPTAQDQDSGRALRARYAEAGEHVLARAAGTDLHGGDSR